MWCPPAVSRLERVLGEFEVGAGRALRGVGWPNGPTDNERLYRLPGSTFTLLDGEHWHLEELRRRRPDALIVQRALPGTLAEHGWDAGRLANAAMRWWGQYPFGERSHLVPHNELNLSYERGDVEDDWDPAAAGPRYERVATLLAEVEIGRASCRERV